jgi:transcription initiation factor IIE alpha subunit
MTTPKMTFDQAFQKVANDIMSTVTMECSLSGKRLPKQIKRRNRHKKKHSHKPYLELDFQTQDPVKTLELVISNCHKKLQLMQNKESVEVLSRKISRLACFTDKFNLAPFKHFLHYVPRIVNVVTVRTCYNMSNCPIYLFTSKL